MTHSGIFFLSIARQGLDLPVWESVGERKTALTCMRTRTRTARYFSVLQLVAVCWQCVAVCCSVLQCAAVWCSVLQCNALCFSFLQCIAVCVLNWSSRKLFLVSFCQDERSLLSVLFISLCNTHAESRGRSLWSEWDVSFVRCYRSLLSVW